MRVKKALFCLVMNTLCTKKILCCTLYVGDACGYSDDGSDTDFVDLREEGAVNKLMAPKFFLLNKWRLKRVPYEVRVPSREI
ncbi:MAG: hypothetical protein RIQ78_659 [Bacteroidota bacterium]|jgi:hypothetical protein